MRAVARDCRMPEEARRSSRYQRARRTAPTPGFVGLIVVIAVLASASPARANPVQAGSNQTSGLSTAGGNTSGPLVVPGTYLTFHCTHGTISLGGTKYCSHAATAGPINLCDSSWCDFSTTGTVDSGYTFYGWVVSAYASVQCGSCLGTTLTLTTPNPGNQYFASLTLDTTPVTLNFAMFENWSTHWTPALWIEVCLGTSCTTAGNGGTMTLGQAETYTLSAIDLVPPMYLFRWTTNAGTLSSATTSPTTFTVASSGIVSLYASTNATSWAGYIYSPTVSTGRVTSVSADFYVPSHVKSYDNGVWVGIGGLTSRSNLFQAVVQVNSTSSGGGLVALMEEVGVATCTPAQGGCVQYSPASFLISVGDKLIVTVTNNSGSCTASFEDITQSETWANTTIWSPNAQTGEWIDEPLGVFRAPQVNFTQMVLNALPLSLVAGLEVDETQGYAVTMLAEQAGYPSFYIDQA